MANGTLGQDQISISTLTIKNQTFGEATYFVAKNDLNYTNLFDVEDFNLNEV